MCVGELGAGWGHTSVPDCHHAQGHTSQPVSSASEAERAGPNGGEWPLSRWGIVPPLAAPFQILGQSRCAKKGRSEEGEERKVGIELTQTKVRHDSGIYKEVCLCWQSFSLHGWHSLFVLRRCHRDSP